jgi:hypothetical protein
LILEKRPRHYAAEIAKLKTLEERRTAIEQVPEHYKEIVKTHLKNTWFVNQHRGN